MENSNIIALVKGFDNIKGCQFVGLNAYESKGSGEISNFTINVGASLNNSKIKDIQYLKSIDLSEIKDLLKDLQKKCVYTPSGNVSKTKTDKTVLDKIKTCENKLKAHSELVTNLIKNLDSDTNISVLKNLLNEYELKLVGNKTNNSIGQTDAYNHICKGVKIHKESNNLYVYGFKINKKIIKHMGDEMKKEYDRKESVKGEKTKFKDEFRKNMKSTKYRTIIVRNVKNIRFDGKTIEFDV